MCDEKKQDTHHEQVNALSPDAKVADDAHQPLKESIISYQWFTNEGHYTPCTGINVKRLVCGEEAFAAIHDAIDKAQSSIDILIWGFDPMMKFKPKVTDETIGQLLERKGKAGVKCRLMVWYDNASKFKEATLIGDTTVVGSALTTAQSGWNGVTNAWRWITDEDPVSQEEQAETTVANSQQERNRLLEEKDHKLEEIAAIKSNQPLSVIDQNTLANKEIELVEIDKQLAAVQASLTGYEGAKDGRSRGPRQYPQEMQCSVEWIRRLINGNIKNVQYKARNFKMSITNNIVSTVNANASETNTNFATNRFLGNFTSHHQKLVLIDYELPNTDTCTAFVMGHNMHRLYWDTKEHYFYDQDAHRDDGFGPWQDISTQVWGEILWDINENFITAWELIKPIDDLKQKRLHITKKDFKPKGSMHALFCRTMPEVQIPSTGSYDRSILATYKKAIKNSFNFIYMENQYFRYKDIAKQIKEQAFDLNKHYKKHATDKEPFYLFVVTNTPKSWSYSSTTYEMFNELGQQQLMPEAQRSLYRSLILDKTILTDKDRQHIDPVETKDDVIKMSQEGQGWDIEGKNGEKPFELEDIDGIKIIIGTLTTDNTITNSSESYKPTVPGGVPEHKTKYTDYREIYIHSKLLVADDLFTFLGSANINTRSFWVDSESGIAIPDSEFAKGMRNELWRMHAKASYNNHLKTRSTAINCDTKKNYEHWNDKMDNNWKHKARAEALECHLTRFWDTETAYAAYTPAVD